MGRKTIAIDFDGVIADVSAGYDQPDLRPGCKEAFEKLKGDGYNIVVFTCRCNFDGGRKVVEEFLKFHGLDRYVDSVTNVKPVALYYLDDRAIRFYNWENAVNTIAVLDHSS